MRIDPITLTNPIVFKSNRPIARPNYASSTDTYDYFTGLKDKTALLRDLGRRMYKKEDISIGMFDMDNFKSVNELLGYKVGDEFIKSIAESISSVAEKHKVDSYRFGGDEFVVLLFKGSPKEEKLEIMQEILESVSSNPVIQSKAGDYEVNANTLLESYEDSNSKIRELMDVNARYGIYNKIWDNATIAREDPYIINEFISVREERKATYLSILEESMETETNEKQKKILKSYMNKMKQESEDVEDIDEYIFERYDKNHETSRLKRWLKDFNKNGFSLTGGIVSFKNSYYKDKQPIDLIDEVGELLKRGKSSSKGSCYLMEVG